MKVHVLAKLLLVVAAGAYLTYRIDTFHRVATSPIDMARGVNALLALRSLQDSLVERQEEGKGDLPDKDFEKWLKEEFKRTESEPVLDPWNRKYDFERIEEGFRVKSGGPDGDIGTEDDIGLLWRAPKPIARRYRLPDGKVR